MSEIHPKILRTDSGPKRIAKTGSAADPAAAATAASPGAAVAANPQATRSARLRAALVVVLGLSLFCYVGQQRRPIGPSAGSLDVRTVVAAVPSGQPASLKLGTYNIHGCKGTDGRTDVERIAGMIGGLDFIGLNEVLGPGLTEKEDQATTLGKQLKMTSHYAPTEERWWHARFGNGFLTKLDVRSWQVVPLERRRGKSYRNFVHIRAKAANGVPLNFVVTHIDRSDDRERHEQLTTVVEYFLSLEKPAVLLGDLNTDEHEPVMVKLLAGTDIVDALAKAKGFNTPRHIDWVLTRGLEVKDAGMSPVGPSDHAHVWAELVVPPLNPQSSRRAWELPFELAVTVPTPQRAIGTAESAKEGRSYAALRDTNASKAPRDALPDQLKIALIPSPLPTVVDSFNGPHAACRIDDAFQPPPAGRFMLSLGGSSRPTSVGLSDDGTDWSKFEPRSTPNEPLDPGFVISLRR